MADVIDIEKFSEDIRVACARLKLSMPEAAKQIGVSHTTLWRVAQRGMPPTMENYNRIANWLEKVEKPA